MLKTWLILTNFCSNVPYLNSNQMNGKHDSKGARTCHVTVSMSRDDVTVHDDLLRDLHSCTRI